MSLAPLLNALSIVRPPKVVVVLRFLEPTLLACRFGASAAFGFGTISLPSPVPAVGGEENTTAWTLALSDPYADCFGRKYREQDSTFRPPPLVQFQIAGDINTKYYKKYNYFYLTIITNYHITHMDIGK